MAGFIDATGGGVTLTTASTSNCLSSNIVYYNFATDKEPLGAPAQDLDDVEWLRQRVEEILFKAA